MIPPTTKRILDFLSDAASYPHRPASVEMVQTHASWVFMAPPFAFKIKKPVNFGFLDFSTLELRRADCEREVRLNRRLAEDVYLGVESVSESGGVLGFSGGGEVVEWVVKMRLLDPAFFLGHLLEQGAVDMAAMDRIIDRLQHFYATQPRPPQADCDTAVERLRLSTEGNFEVAAKQVGRCLSPPAFDAIRHFTSSFFSGQMALLGSRISGGWIRDCHGDLHSEHIHLAADAVRIYDCIEFNTRFRYIDLASDLAFLAMDLDFHGRSDLAGHLVRRFAALLQDDDMGRLMDFYKCYRACVRGKVESLHGAAETSGEVERAASLDLARRYFRLALRYAICGSQPCALVFMGRVASGKSALAAALGAELDVEVISSDALRKRLAGVPAHYRGTRAERESLYAPEMTERTYAALATRAREMTGKSRCVILDATFSKHRHRDRLREALAGCTTNLIWVEARAGEDVVRARLAARESADGIVSDARLEDLEALHAGFEEAEELSAADKITLCTDGDPGDTLRTLLEDLAGRRAAASD